MKRFEVRVPFSPDSLSCRVYYVDGTSLEEVKGQFEAKHQISVSVTEIEIPRLTKAQRIRIIASQTHHGQKRTPRGLILLKGYHSFHEHAPHDWRTKHGFSQPEWDELVTYLKRYHRFVHYCREILPQWRKVDITYYADNSIEEVQEDRWGNRRQVMVEGPSGDACY